MDRILSKFWVSIWSLALGRETKRALKRTPTRQVLVFATLWLLSAISLGLLAWRVEEFCNLTSQHWVLALSSGMWWRCFGLLVSMVSLAAWVQHWSRDYGSELIRRVRP